MDQPPPAVLIENLRYSWRHERGFYLSVPHLRVERGEKLLLKGPSGSGKSTLLALICGAAVPAAGGVRIAGKQIESLSPSARDRMRGESIGVIFQSLQLIPYLSAIENVLLPLSFASGRARRIGPTAAQRREALDLLERLALDHAGIADARSDELSIGQQQRVAAARALIGSPALVVADEPTSALDRDLRDAFLSVLLAESARCGTSVVLASHDEGFEPLFDRVLHMRDIVARDEAA